MPGNGQHLQSMFVDYFQAYVDRYLEPSLRKGLLEEDVPYKCLEKKANARLMVDVGGELE